LDDQQAKSFPESLQPLPANHIEHSKQLQLDLIWSFFNTTQQMRYDAANAIASARLEEGLIMKVPP
jgi:hypothetical protein